MPFETRPLDLLPLELECRGDDRLPVDDDIVGGGDEDGVVVGIRCSSQPPLPMAGDAEMSMLSFRSPISAMVIAPFLSLKQ